MSVVPTIAGTARADEQAPVVAAPRTPEPLKAGDEVVALRNAFGNTYATDVPGEFRTVMHSRPVNFKTADGNWKPIDTTLARSGDQLVQADNGISVSLPATGAGVSRLTLDSTHSVSYGTPVGSLPVSSTLSKDVVSLTNILPGSSLRYASQWNGYKSDIVLSSPASPSSYTFPLQTPGLTARIDEAGNVLFSDAAGTVRAMTPHGFMTDSNVDARSGDPARSDDVAYELVNVGGLQALKVTLDRGWLTAPARQYPVTVDPTLVTYPADADDMFVQAPYTNDYSADVELKAGTFNGGSDKARSFLHFSGVNALDGKVINSAYFKPYEFHSYSCTRTNVSVYRITGAWSGTGNRTYPGPGLSDKIFTVSEARGYSSACPAARITFNVSGLVRNWASNTWANNGLAIIADSETDSLGWKKFDSRNGTNDPQLEVTWSEPNRAPSQVGGRSVSGNCTGCNPGITADASPTLTGTATDPDLDTIKYFYEIHNGWLTSVDASGNASTAATPAASGSTAFLASGTASSFTSPTLPDGKYSYRVQAYDGAVYGPWSSGWAQFTIDAVGPTVAISSSTHPNPNLWYSNNSPTLNWSATSESSVTGYSYSMDQSTGGAPDYVSEGTGTSTSYSGLGDGIWYFRARALNAANVWGLVTTYSVAIDTTAPAAPATASSSSHTVGAVSSNRNIATNWSAGADSTSGVAGYSYVYNTSPATAADAVIDTTGTTATSTALSDGTWYFHVRTVDKAGNASTDKVLGPFVIDGTGPNAPVIASTTHPDQSDSAPWSTNRDASFSWVAADANPIAGYAVSWDENLNGDPGMNVTQTANTYSQTGIPDRVKYLHVRAFDGAGNPGGVGTFRVRIDATAPAAPAIVATNSDGSFADGTSTGGRYWSNSSPELAWSATDNSALTGSGITGYSFVFDQNPATDPGTPVSPTNTTSLSRANLADGVYYLHVRARNGANTWSGISRFAVKVDATNPTAAVATSPTHNTVDAVSTQTVRMTWASQPGSDATSGLAGYSYSFTTNAADLADQTVDTTGTAVDTPLADGTYYFHLRTLDRAGNSSHSHYGPIRISQAAPPVSDTDKNRFVSLWSPRAKSTTFYQGYFAQNAYPSDVLAEGYHELTSNQKHYLVDQLTAALVSDGTLAGLTQDQIAQTNDELFLFVFDKNTVRDTGPYNTVVAGGETVAQVASTRPSAVTATLNRVLDLYSPADATIPDLPVASDLVVEPDAIDPPSALESATTAVASTDVSGILADVQSAQVDGLAAVTDDLATATLDADAPTLTGPIFTLPTTGLPLDTRYTVCWRAFVNGSLRTGCVDSPALNVPTAFDVSGDGSNDLEANFGIRVADLSPAVGLPVSYTLGRPTLPQLTPSDQAGKTISANVWVVYDLRSANRRIKVGFDGLDRGERLSQTTSATATFSTPTTLTDGELTGRYTVTHSDPGSSWTLTASSTTIGSDTDGAALSVRFASVPTSFSADVVDRHAGGLDGKAPRELKITGTTSTHTNLDVRLHTESSGETGDTRALVDGLQGTASVSLVTDQQSPSVTRLTAQAEVSLPRVAYSRRITRQESGASRVENLAIVARDLPTQLDGSFSNSGTGFTLDPYTASGPIGRFSIARSESLDGSLTTALAARVIQVPRTVKLRVGALESGKGFSLTYEGAARVPYLTASYYNASNQLAFSGNATGVPAMVGVTVDPDARQFTQTADSPFDYLSVIARKGGLKAYRPGVEHATVIKNGDDFAASALMRGLTLMQAGLASDGKARFASRFAPGGQRVRFYAKFDAVTSLADISNIPQALDVTYDGEATGDYVASSGVSRAIGYFHQGTGKKSLDAVLTGVPLTVHLLADFSDKPQLTYDASGTLDSGRILYISDGVAGDNHGTTVEATLASVPSHVDASGDRDAGILLVNTNGTLGTADVRFSSNGGKARRLPGDFISVNSQGTTFGLAAVLHGVKSAKLDMGSTTRDAVLESHLQPGGQALTALGRLGTSTLAAGISNMPADVKATFARATGRFDWEASSAISKATLYKANTNGKTFQLAVTGVPTSFYGDVDTTSPYRLTFHGSAAVTQVDGYYSPQYVATPTKTGVPYITIRVTSVPKDFTAVSDGATTLDYSAPTSTGSVRVRSDQLFGANLYAYLDASGIPSGLNVTKGTDNKVAVVTRGGRIEDVTFGLSNNGKIKRLPGLSLYFRQAVTSQAFTASGRITGVNTFAYDPTGDDIHVQTAVDLGGNPLNVDVQYDKPVNAQSDNYRYALAGSITDLPTDLRLDVVDRRVTYSATGNVEAHLSGAIGYITALQAAETPKGRSGLSVTDGACYTTNGCRPTLSDGSQAPMCSSGSNACYAYRLRFDLAGMPRTLVFDPRAGQNLLRLTDLRLATAGATVQARADLNDVLSQPLRIDVQQAGVPQGAQFVLKSASFSSDNGLIAKFVTDNSADFGAFRLALSLPNVAMEDGNQRVTNLLVTAYLASLPARVDASFSQQQEATGFTGSFSAPVGTLNATLNTRLEFRDSPSAAWQPANQPAAVRLDLENVAKTEGAQAPDEPYVFLEYRPQDSTKFAGHSIRGSKVVYRSPAAGLNAVVGANKTLLNVLIPGQTTVITDDAVAGLLSAGKELTVGFDLDKTDLVIASPKGRLGEFFAATSASVQIPNTVIDESPEKIGLRFDIDGKVQASMEFTSVDLSVKNVATFRTQFNKVVLGIDGDYGQVSLRAGKVAIDTDSALKVTIEPKFRWAPKLYDTEVKIKGQFNTVLFRPSDPNASGGPCLSVPRYHADLKLRPAPLEGVSENGFTHNGANGARVYTFLDLRNRTSDGLSGPVDNRLPYLLKFVPALSTFKVIDDDPKIDASAGGGGC